MAGAHLESKQLNHTKIRKNCLQRDISICILSYSNSIPGSQHQARTSYNFYNKYDHKATIVAFWPPRVKE